MPPCLGVASVGYVLRLLSGDLGPRVRGLLRPSSSLWRSIVAALLPDGMAPNSSTIAVACCME